ncbi:alanine racemase [Subtercola sp. Z020]|uniref:alanine racemase n=1 Tax=Subtercola sp. Z020 TaxID=2080582 RepID=UPI0011B067BA|nr:alanine racemase [Subtercola sp. Z020]
MAFDDLPRMVLHDAAIDHNIALMSAFCERSGMLLAPHAKTHLSRELCDRQLAAGAWGLTAATTSQVRTLVGFGASRILHANVLVDAAAIDFVAETFLGADSRLDYLCYVDSLAGLDLLERRLDEWGQEERGLDERGPAKRLRVLVEVGFEGGRTGVRRAADARQLAHAVAASTRLELAGVAGYEGLMPTGSGAHPDAARGMLAGIRNLVTYLHEQQFFADVPVVTAGGSSYFDLVAEELGPDAFDFDVLSVLRSGCYLTHDHGVYERTSPFGATPRLQPAGAFVPAFELLASVLSAPEPGLVIAGFGRREVPTDDRLPVVLGSLDDGTGGADGADGAALDTSGWVVTGVNDHHAYLRVPADTVVAPGTVLRFGISHPCGAFDRWRSIPLVDDAYAVVGQVSPAL